jgi:predicted permease
MTQILLAIAPIFLLIILGHALRRGGIPTVDFWNLNDKLVYWVLFPSLLFYKMATMELSGQLLESFASVIYAGFAAALVFGLLAGWVFRLDRPLWTSVLQGCARHNTFIALAVAERVFGGEGLALASLITALLIPVTNVSVVTLMVVLLRGGDGHGSHERRSLLRSIFRDLTRNPLLIAVALGISVNLAGIEHVPVLYDMVIILGGAALPIVLLCVGANLRVQAMRASVLPTVVSVVGKMLLFPAVLGFAALAVGLDASAAMVVMVFGAVPSSAGAYTLARQMGGDAPAMAAMVTIQTAVSFVTLPLTLMYAERIFSAALIG